MTDLLGMSASKGRTIVTILAAEFPRLRGQVDKLVSFRTMTYVQANILHCTSTHTPREELFEQPDRFKTPSKSSTSKNIRQRTGPYILTKTAIIA